MKDRAYLILQDGSIFAATRFGAAGERVGELVFTTAMTGYLETLTDPSYYGQIVVQTFPAPSLSAYIVREHCMHPSNFRCEGGLDAFLKRAGIVGMCGIDTRALTRIIRESGVMNAMISDSLDNLDDKLTRIRAYRVADAVASVSTHAGAETLGPDGDLRVALWDFGAKGSIAKHLTERGLSVTVFGARATADEIAAMEPDGIMLSNGPGDPAENTAIIAELQKLCILRIPTFGICLGHQLLALSQGAETHKLKYGHRGANQPARDVRTGRVYITSQNHGYAVLADTLPSGASERFVNANDGTCEGIDYTSMPAFSVQFHPEAAAGPLDTGFLFDRFAEMMRRHKTQKGGGAHA